MAKIFDWKDKEKLKKIVEKSITQTEVLKVIGLQLKSGNYQTLLKYIKLHNLDINHFDGRKVAYNKLKQINQNKLITNEQYFILNSSRNNSHSKRRILKDNLKSHKCEDCGCLPEWNGRTLSLQLDHINGDNQDNRLENLRFLCPNCHSQTINFAGKNKKNRDKQKVFDIKIFETNRKAPSKEDVLLQLKEKGVRETAIYFQMSIKNLKFLCNHYEISLYKKSNNLKIDWPTLEELQKLILTDNLTNIGKNLGITSNAVKKHVRKNKLFLPTDISQGYWLKKGCKQIVFEDLKLEQGQYILKQ